MAHHLGSLEHNAEISLYGNDFEHGGKVNRLPRFLIWMYVCGWCTPLAICALFAWSGLDGAVVPGVIFLAILLFLIWGAIGKEWKKPYVYHHRHR